MNAPNLMWPAAAKRPSSTIAEFNPAASPEAAAVWNDIVAPKYVAFESVLVSAAQAHSDLIWSELKRIPFARALDVGCGSGDSAARLARGRLDGHVTGIDCAEPLLQLAKRRYRGRHNLDWVAADIGTYVAAEPFELCFSRFGLMFFERPVQALRWIRSQMRPGAPLRTLVWQAREHNPWLNLARDAVLMHLPPVNAGAPSCGPGPFSMADPATVCGQLEAAGFSRPTFIPLTRPVWIGDTPETAADFQLAIGPAGEIARHAAEAQHPGLKAARSQVVRALQDHHTPRGVILPSASWWIQAHA